MKTILFQGDSITDMGRNRDYDLDMGCGYPTLVAASLGAGNPGQFRCVNRGISGNRVIDLLARVKCDMINLKPDYLTILIGVNDVWHEFDFQNGIETALFEQYYDMLLTQLQEALPQTKLMILEPFVLKASATADKWEPFRAETEAKAAAARRVAEKHQVVFVPLMKVFDDAQALAPADYWLYDGVHPTAMGHELIKQEWLKGFDKL